MEAYDEAIETCFYIKDTNADVEWWMIQEGKWLNIDMEDE